MKEIRMTKHLERKIGQLERKKKTAYRAGATCLGIGIIGSMINPALFMMTLVGIALLIGGRNRERRLASYQAGMSGEERLVGQLRNTLQNASTLFVNVPMGGRDIDCLAVGPDGIRVMEAKHYSGAIICNGDAWSRLKTLRGETHAYALPSFSRQVKENIRHLKAYLASRGIKAWIDGIVVITHDRATLEVEGLKNIQALTLAQLNQIQPGRSLSAADQKRIEDAIIDLQRETA